MNQISKDKLCYYCLGCNLIEQIEGVRNCDRFVPYKQEWQKEYYKNLKENTNAKNSNSINNKNKEE